MSWNYSGNPADSDLDKVRFLVGDVRSDEPIMQDEEIQFLIDTYGSNENTLMFQAFSRAATLFARDVKRSLGPQSEDPTERLKYFKEQIEYYKKRQTTAGISIPAYAHDKVFERDMHSNPPASSTSILEGSE